jgi:hypothetical protein
LLADALRRSQFFDAVIYYSPDRLFRDILEFEMFRSRLEEEHVTLICVTDPWLAATVRKSSSERYQSPYPNLRLVGNTWKSRRVRDHQRNRSR